jgi:hypothetical protein
MVKSRNPLHSRLTSDCIWPGTVHGRSASKISCWISCELDSLWPEVCLEDHDWNDWHKCHGGSRKRGDCNTRVAGGSSKILHHPEYEEEEYELEGWSRGNGKDDGL